MGERIAEGPYEDNRILFGTALGNRISNRNAERSFTEVTKKAGIRGISIYSIRYAILQEI